MHNEITHFGSRGSGFQDEGDTEIILIGGGTARFTDRPSILGADYAFTPIYREIATFTLPSTASGTPMERCLEPDQPGKGYWIAQDRRFGYGLNITEVTFERFLFLMNRFNMFTYSIEISV